MLNKAHIQYILQVLIFMRSAITYQDGSPEALTGKLTYTDSYFCPHSFTLILKMLPSEGFDL